MKRDSSFDRRKYPRVMTESVVSIARVAKPDGLAHAMDLSLSGIRFQSVGLDVEPGEVVRVQLTIGDRTVSVVGELVRVTDLDAFAQEVALAFIDVDPDTELLLRQSLPEDYELEERGGGS